MAASPPSAGIVKSWVWLCSEELTISLLGEGCVCVHVCGVCMCVCMCGMCVCVHVWCVHVWCVHVWCVYVCGVCVVCVCVVCVCMCMSAFCVHVCKCVNV